MKKLIVGAILLLGMLGLGSQAKSQTLEFSRVVMKTFTNTSAPDTVPAGKVWKLTTVGGNGVVFLRSINGQDVYQQLQVTSSSPYASALPAWFPAGAVLRFQENTSYTAYYSIIEFTVVP